LLLVLASAVILMSESRGTYDHILLSQIRDSSNLEGQVPLFISSMNRVARFYPKALNFLFVASYDSQGYGGDTPPGLVRLSFITSRELDRNQILQGFQYCFSGLSCIGNVCNSVATVR
jgi:hypothetical protein